MRTLLILLCIVFLAAACSSSGSRKSGEEEVTGVSLSSENLIHIHLDVKGMTCEGCENAIIASVQKLEGISEASASHPNEEVMVVFDSTQTTLDAISNAIADAGYSVEGEKPHAH